MASDDIPTAPGTGANICADCGHHGHWKHECDCGCPDGVTRKRERDAGDVSSHAPAEGRAAEGFY